LVQLKKYFMHNPNFNLELYQRTAYLDPFDYERMTLAERVAARQSLTRLLSNSCELALLGENRNMNEPESE